MKSPDERVVSLLQEARRQLELERSRRTEPVAVIGIGCRFPGGVEGPSDFWRLLSDGVSATREVPADRWNAEAFYDPDPEIPGKAYTRRGSFLTRVDAFDPAFFGISPREAEGMDPQQRLVLEVAWEALEDAGIAPDRLRESATGVWLGLCTDDYAYRSVASGNPDSIDAYNALGNTRSIAAGRLSYILDLRGPAVQLDTACSSSLVGVHQACQSLRSRECDLALVGGVNLMLSPESTIALSKLRALAPDGTCKTFDAAADGYGRGEGCGIVVLKRLSDAQRDGDRVEAVIRGSAANHDGHSNGLTAPSGVAQEAVIRAALANGGVDGSSVGYVEAHGTGTLLGDPIELLALQRVYGREREASSPLYVGAVKTNFGHLEGAAGIAGLIKAVLCLQHAELPPHLNFKQPNPKVPWANLALRVVTERTPWQSDGKPRLAGVSSFGISGTNAHVIVEEAPASEPRASAPKRSAELVVLSAKAPAALPVMARRLLEHLQAHPKLELGDVAFSLATTRAQLDYRLALAVPNGRALVEALQRVAATDVASLHASRPAVAASPVVFVFPGQGSQWLGMGRSLLEEEPVFRAALLECDRAIHAETGWSVLQELGAAPERSRLSQVDVVQPVLFALQVALAALWRSWGVVPAAVVGHSMGEVAAACVAGALSLQDGAAVICRRSQLLRQISGQGEMALVELSLEEAQAALTGYEQLLAVAVSNGPRSTVLSGHPDALAQVLAKLERRNVFCRRVKVDVASHSPQVDPLLEELQRELRELQPRAAELNMHSTVTGAPLEGTELGASYWADNLRQPVRFGATIEGLLREGRSLFLEISPHPLLVTAVEQLRADLGADGVALGSLRREQPERQTLLEALGSLHVQGLPLAAERLFPAGGRSVPLPSYPWQRQRYWLEAPAAGRRDAGVATRHPLLGVRMASAGADAVYECVLSALETPWLADFRVAGQVVVPATVLAELMRAAAEDSAQGAACELRELKLAEPLVMLPAGARRIQVTIFEQGSRASVHSQPARASMGAAWSLHATAAADVMTELVPRSLDLQGCRQRCSTPVPASEIYEQLGARGLEYGPSLRGLRQLWRGPEEMLAEIELACEPDERYPAHPALFEAAIQLLATCSGVAAELPVLPGELGRFAIHREVATGVLAHLRLAAPGGRAAAQVTLTDSSGAIIAELGPASVRPATPGSEGELRHIAAREAFFRLLWRESRPPAPAAQLSGTWRVLSARGRAAAQQLVAELSELGASAEALAPAQLSELPAMDHLVCLFDDQHGDPAECALRAGVVGLAVAQALARHATLPRVWWITSGSVPVTEREELHAAGAAVWGLGRTVQQEQPELPLLLLDVDGARSLPGVLLAELSAEDGENQIAWRDGKRFAARLVRASSSGAPAHARAASGGERTALIAGALDASSADLARELVERGIRHLILTAPRGLDGADAGALAAELRALGAQVTLAEVDVADRQALARLLATIPASQPLEIVAHALAGTDDGLLQDQTVERFAEAMAPKVRGAWNLHACTEGMALDQFVLFSSASGALGSASQGADAAANAFLDALAAQRRAQGRPALSIAWGPWSRAVQEPARSRLARLGIGVIPPQSGRVLLRAALDQAESQLLVLPLDLRTMTQGAERVVAPLWRSLLRGSSARAKARTEHWAKELMALPPEQRRAPVLSLVRAAVAVILSLSGPEAVPPERALKDLGLDSLMAVELRNSLVRRAGVSVRSSLAFDVALSTPATIAQRLLDALGDGGASASQSVLRDGTLTEALTPHARAPEFADPERVLLTGATGFLGAFILSELLEQTRARVTCLVRAADAGAGLARVVENLDRYGLWRPAARERLDVVVGELTEPRLGLSPSAWAELAESVDSIYSNASHVSYVATYEELKGSHVGATNEMLRLACAGRPKALNHISSIAAYDTVTYRARDFREDETPDVGVGFHLAYSQCKWAAESLVRQAGQRGVPVIVYRPGFIGGSSKTGAWSTGDFLCRLFASIIQQECFPSDLDILLDFSPVDYVSRSVVFLSRQAASFGRAFNLHNPSGILFQAVQQLLIDLGYRVAGMPHLRWLDILGERRDPALFPLVPFLRDPASAEGHSNLELAQRQFRPRLSCSETVRALAKGGITCPAIDHALIARYLEHMAARGLICAQPAPGHQPGAVHRVPRPS